MTTDLSPTARMCIPISGDQMYETTVKYVVGVRFEAQARGHRVLCDQPLANGGSNEGMSPPELMLASVATCAGYYALQYLLARKMSTADLTIQVAAEKAMQPARLGTVRI